MEKYFIVMYNFRNETLHVITSLNIDWNDLFLLHLLTTHLKMNIRVKYGDFYSNPENVELFKGFPYSNISFIKPLAKHPSFGSLKWELEPSFYVLQLPIYIVYSSNLSLIVDGNLIWRDYTFTFNSGHYFYTITTLPQLALDTQHIVSRHPLSRPASFNPLLPLDSWSWILSCISFSLMGLLILISHMSLRPTQGSLLLGFSANVPAENRGIIRDGHRGASPS